MLTLKFFIDQNETNANIEVLTMIEIVWYYIHFYELSWNAFLFYLPSQNCRIGI